MAYDISIQNSNDAIKYLIDRYLKERTQHFIYSIGMAVDPNKVKINLEKGIAEEIVLCMCENLVNLDCEVLMINPYFKDVMKYASKYLVVKYKGKAYLLEYKHIGEYTIYVDRITITPLEILELKSKN